MYTSNNSAILLRARFLIGLQRTLFGKTMEIPWHLQVVPSVYEEGWKLVIKFLGNPHNCQFPICARPHFFIRFPMFHIAFPLFLRTFPMFPLLFLPVSYFRSADWKLWSSANFFNWFGIFINLWSFAKF